MICRGIVGGRVITDKIHSSPVVTTRIGEKAEVLTEQKKSLEHSLIAL